MSNNGHNDTVPSRVVPGLRSPRPGTGADHASNFEFMAYEDHPEDNMEADLSSLIGRTDSGIIRSGSVSSGKSDDSYNKQKSRKRRRPIDPSSSSSSHILLGDRSMNDSTENNLNYPQATQDHFLNVIQEQIPLLEQPVTQRKRSSSTAGSNKEASPPVTSSPGSNGNTVLTARPFCPAPERSDPSLPKASKKPKSQHHSGPKRPRTAYIIFLEHFRQTYNEKFPNTNFNDCQKLAGKKWRSLSDVEKQPWKDQERLSQKDFIHKMHGLQYSFGLVKEANTSPASSSYSSASAKMPRKKSSPGNSASSQSSSSSSSPPSTHSSSTRTQLMPESDRDQEHFIHTNSSTDDASILVHQHQMKQILDATVPNKMNELMRGPKNGFSMYVHSMRDECQRKDPNLS